MKNDSKISAVVLTYNNEDSLFDCLSSISWADEIIVLDSFSTDKTVEIAKKFTDKIFQKPFESFGKLRNQSIELASHSWIFSLDTDEVATPKAIEEIKKIAQDNGPFDAYFVPRSNTIFGKRLRFGGFYPDYRQPQFYRKGAMQFHEKDLVHEGFTINGQKGYISSYIVQKPFRNLSHYLNKMERYSTLMSKRMHQNKRTFKAHQLISHPLFSFFKMYFLRLGILDGFAGFLLAILYTYYTFIKYVKLWEIEKKSTL